MGGSSADSQWGYYGYGPGWFWVCGCEQSGNDALHAHLVGGNTTSSYDLAPSAVCATVFYLLAGGAFYRYKRSLAYQPLIIMAWALLFTAIAFTIRAALANTSSEHMTTISVAFEQILFLAGEMLLLSSYLVITRDLINKVHPFHLRARFAIFSHLLLFVALVLALVAFADYTPNPISSFEPKHEYSALRLVSALIVFAIALFNLVMLLIEKGQHPILGWVGWAPCAFAALALLFPAFYVFVGTAVTDDTSQLVCSTLWFYIAFGLCQAAAVVPSLVWLFPDELYARAAFLARGNPRAQVAEAEAHLERDIEKNHIARARAGLEADLLANAAAHNVAEGDEFLMPAYDGYAVAEPHY